MNCEGGPAPQGRPGRPWPPQFLAPSPKITISPSSDVVGTSNSSIHFHSVAIGAARRLLRRMRVQILTHATEEGVVIQRRVDADFQSFLSFRSDVTSQPLSPLNRVIAANTFGFKRIAFWGIYSHLRCMSAYALKALV